MWHRLELVDLHWTQTVGIAVDHRRNRSLEGLQTNAQRLKEFTAKLLVFRRRLGKVKNGDSSAEELASRTQVKGVFIPITLKKFVVDLLKVNEETRSFIAYQKPRLKRTNNRHHGARLERAAEAKKEEK